MDVSSGINRPKTHKGKLIHQRRQPQLVEGEKTLLCFKCSTANDLVTNLMRDISKLRRNNTVFLSRKNDIHPLEDSSKVEFLCSRNETPLFMCANHSKKRPNNLLIGRTYDDQLLDLFEFEVKNYEKMESFKVPKITLGGKGIVNFVGDAFETQHEYIRLKNLFVDLFASREQEAVRLAGIEYVVSIAAIEGKIHFRFYKVSLLKSGSRLPYVKLDEMGPRFDLTLRRNQMANEDLFKKALKQPYQLNPQKPKNKSISSLGTTYGRIHLGRQNYTRLNLKASKLLKRKRVLTGANAVEANEPEKRMRNGL